jgi:putative aminopeptidase FrvX
MILLAEKFNKVESIIAKTMEYLSIPSVVGSERFFLNYLYNDFSAMGLSVFKHPGLLEVHGDDPGSAILCAHIDRHGLVSLGNGEYVYAAQYIREIKYGEENKASQKELKNITGRFDGETVFAYDPDTGQKLGSGVIETCENCILNGDAIFHVRGMDVAGLNIPLAYARTAKEENGRIKGQIDNAISLGVIHQLFANGFQGTVLLSTEEEIGKSWTHVAAWLESHNVNTRALLVIDTSPYVDPEPIETGRVILRNRDMSETFNPALVKELKERCEDMELPFQFKDEMLLASGKVIEQLGSTELGRVIQKTNRRWSGATVQIPTLAYHTSNETTTREAIKNYYTLLHNILIQDPLDMIAISRE